MNILIPMMNKFRQILFFLLYAGFFACTQNDPMIKLQSGDLLFREETSGNISSAIDKVTQTSAQTHFSHMGLVEVSDTGIVIL